MKNELEVFIETLTGEEVWNFVYDYRPAWRGSRNDPPEPADVEFTEVRKYYKGKVVEQLTVDEFIVRFSPSAAQWQDWVDQAVESAETDFDGDDF